ncbi:MAG TPA: hypothetical protein DEP42_01820, partial [Ruminococcaceae bacterium]|nr:hypothetical protein [Oscillospiraceae bacterium]
PKGLDGAQYVALVAALSTILSENLDAENTLVLSELLNQVSNQLITISAFKQTEEDRRRNNETTLGKNLADAAAIRN